MTRLEAKQAVLDVPSGQCARCGRAFVMPLADRLADMNQCWNHAWSFCENGSFCENEDLVWTRLCACGERSYYKLDEANRCWHSYNYRFDYHYARQAWLRGWWERLPSR